MKGCKGYADWMEIEASGPPSVKDAVVEMLIDAGSPGIIDGDQPGGLKGYLPSSGSGAVAALEKGLESLGWNYTARPFRSADWTTQWKKDFKAIRISNRLLVKPTWIGKKYKGVVIEIDPGMAFGTGSHPTTRMCLRALERLLAANHDMDVLDVGTGSGILAIGASKLGAVRVVGIDADAQALKIARSNARLNGVRITVSGKSLDELKGRFSVVVANILSDLLVKISLPLVKRMRDKGYLVLSGILEEQEVDVMDHFTRYNLRLHRRIREGEWRTLIYEKA